MQALCGEVTWVTSDHVPGPGPGQPQLGVRVGQQVELLDRLDNHQDMVLVRLCPTSLSEVTRPELQEGYVPVSCLKLPPSKTFQFSKQHQQMVGESDQGKKVIFIYLDWVKDIIISNTNSRCIYYLSLSDVCIDTMPTIV